MFQSTLPLRAATCKPLRLILSGIVSIHTALTGSDGPCSGSGSPALCFNPHCPYGQRLERCGYRVARFGFNPHCPYGQRRRLDPAVRREAPVSIHTALTGSDVDRAFTGKRGLCFNPHCPYGQRRVIFVERFPTIDVSIHTALTGSDDRDGRGD